MRKLLSRFKRTVRYFRPSRNGPSVSAKPPTAAQAEPAQVETKIACIDPRLNAPLENLPPEVRRQILFTLDFEGLRTLTHASPVYHQQFILDRKPLLRRCLENTLRSVAVEAYFVQQSSSASFSKGRTKDGIAQFLQSYQAGRSSPHSVLQEVTSDEASKMIAFHISIVEPLVAEFTRWALDNLNKFAGTQQKHQPLSTAEETRVLRALYRYELCCHLFGLGAHLHERPNFFNFESAEILELFAGPFEPWEVEEIFCVCRFAQNKYNQIFDAISWDVNENNPKFDGERPPTPEGAFDLTGSYPRCSFLTAVLSRGLPLLHTVLFQIQNHDHLVTTMQEQIDWPLGSFFDDDTGNALDDTSQYFRWREHPSERDAMQDRRDPLSFQGDRAALVGSDGVWTSLPPLAWTVLWRGTYSNIFGSYVPEEIQRWGYVLWDGKRMEETGTKEALARWLEKEWEEGDPRDWM
ncbi:hypothetical protein ATERTT37_007059 [Aspergillus terreus]